MALYGVDVSHHQDWIENEIDPVWRHIVSTSEFVMMKLTEGDSYVDTKAYNLLPYFKNGYGRIGFYHYLRPERVLNPAYEAYKFITQLDHLGVIGKAILAVDVEDKAFTVSDYAQYTRDFLDCVYQATQVRPLLYTSESKVPTFKCVADGNYGLWVAKWDSKTFPKCNPFYTCAMWQTTVFKHNGKSMDLDWFNGGTETWAKYAKGDRN